VPLLREKKEPVLKSTGRKPPVFYDKVLGWVRFQRQKHRRPSKTVREFKREFHNAFEFLKDEIKEGLTGG